MSNRIFATFLPKFIAKTTDLSLLKLTLALSDDIDFENASTMADVSDNVLSSSERTTPLTIDGPYLKPQNTTITLPVAGTQQIIGVFLADNADNLIGFTHFGNLREITDSDFLLELPTQILRVREEVM